ncbi:hypothetical protein RHMOL_Rhmol04G0262800 [Rhododendron molle]|uniref:Uncharacterized protein n=1 Tax=Rhododendron molle TaxID=49168 RepID=A0ACC0P5M4_RHOML|nr:hypothetical protein RHMOL_Rhmol04G0262800 [Rhododendron molle]
MIYPNSKGNANQSITKGRSPLASGGACSLASGVHSDSTKGHLDGTDEGRSTTLAEDFNILQQGQVASREVDIRSNGTKECARLSDKEYTTPTEKISGDMDHAFPSLGLSPICQSSNKVLESNTQYFVEEPDSPRAALVNNLDLEVDLGVSSPIPKPLSPPHPDDEAEPQSVNSETTLAVADSSFNQEKGRVRLRGNQRGRGRYGGGRSKCAGKEKRLSGFWGLGDGDGDGVGGGANFPV